MTPDNAHKTLWLAMILVTALCIAGVLVPVKCQAQDTRVIIRGDHSVSEGFYLNPTTIVSTHHSTKMMENFYIEGKGDKKLYRVDGSETTYYPLTNKKEYPDQDIVIFKLPKIDREPSMTTKCSEMTKDTAIEIDTVIIDGIEEKKENVKGTLFGTTNQETVLGDGLTINGNQWLGYIDLYRGMSGSPVWDIKGSLIGMANYYLGVERLTKKGGGISCEELKRLAKRK